MSDYLSWLYKHPQKATVNFQFRAVNLRRWWNWELFQDSGWRVQAYAGVNPNSFKMVRYDRAYFLNVDVKEWVTPLYAIIEVFQLPLTLSIDDN